MLRKVFISLCVNIQGAWKDLVKKQHLRKTLASSVGALAGADVGGGAAAILSKIKKKKDKKDKKKKDSKVKFKFEDDGDPDTDEDDDDEEDGDSGSSSSSEDQAQIRSFRFFLLSLSFPPFVFFLQFLLHHRLLSLSISHPPRVAFFALSLLCTVPLKRWFSSIGRRPRKPQRSRRIGRRTTHSLQSPTISSHQVACLKMYLPLYSDADKGNTKYTAVVITWGNC